ncbi:MAG TPA: hypothetical protein VHT04_08165 [Stellaceae bacterium]|jgi:hypothetical protein|nr:hypothetical protein [Stellaceae bacterium]
MGTIYAARSVKLSKWGNDVGLSKHLYKIGYTEEPLKKIIEQGWAGERDWTVVAQQEVEGLSEDDVIERVARKQKPVDPNFYPRLKEARGIFKVLPAHVENHMLMTRALAGEAERVEIKLKPADFGAFLIHNALR